MGYRAAGAELAFKETRYAMHGFTFALLSRA
jgi:hypothetical protein